MTARKRLLNIISALVMIFSGIGMIMYPDDGYIIVVAILDVTLLAYSIKNFIYYFTMGRFMVGGQASLIKAVVSLDFGVFVFSLQNMPKKPIMLYLLSVLAFSGVADILHAKAAGRLMIKSWKFELFQGVTKLIICIISLFFLDSLRILTIIYAAGLFHAALSNIITAFQKTALVYVN